MTLTDFKGPKRKTYYDMDPWYLKNSDSGINDWHQQIDALNSAFQEEISDFIKNKRPLKIIEAACGGGNFTLAYAKPGVKIDAFEFSKIAVEMAKKKDNPCNVNFYQGDALSAASYLNRPYDLLVAKDLLHCLIGGDRAVLLNNLRDSVSESGSILLSTHIGLPVSNKEILRGVDPATRVNKISTRIYLDRDAIEAEFGECGLKPVKTIVLDEYYAAIYELVRL